MAPSGGSKSQLSISPVIQAHLSFEILMGIEAQNKKNKSGIGGSNGQILLYKTDIIKSPEAKTLKITTSKTLTRCQFF